MPDRIIGAGWLGSASLGAAGSGRPTAHDIATRMLAFSKARLGAFAPYGMVINDVAWDVLLILFVAQERGQRLSLRQACQDIALPFAVTLRWVRALHDSGLVAYDEQGEGMAAPVRLTPAAEGAMRGLLEGNLRG